MEIQNPHNRNISTPNWVHLCADFADGNPQRIRQIIPLPVSVDKAVLFSFKRKPIGSSPDEKESLLFKQTSPIQKLSKTLATKTTED